MIVAAVPGISNHDLKSLKPIATSKNNYYKIMMKYHNYSDLRKKILNKN